MIAVQIVKPGVVRQIDIPAPVSVEEGYALLKVKAVGICGSDIGAFRGTNALVSYPRIIGHEIVGEIVCIGQSNPKGLKVGDRVVVDPYLYCGKCYPCSIGRTNCCDDLKVLGVHVDGGMTEYFIHPDAMLLPIPDKMPWELAALAEPVTISLHGIHRGRVKKGESILIFGAGPIGIIAAIIAKYYGANPILADIVQERLDFARKLGIDNTVNSSTEDIVSRIDYLTGGKKVQVVMEASGSNAAIKKSLEVVCNAGRIVFTGWPKEDTLFSTSTITKKELDLVGARTSANEFQEALSLLQKPELGIQRILTKTVHVFDAAETLTEIEKNPGRYMKVVVLF